MRNCDCEIRQFRNGRRIRTFRYVGGPRPWVQHVATSGRTYPMTDAQLLSHVLPTLVKGHPVETIVIRKDRKRSQPSACDSLKPFGGAVKRRRDLATNPRHRDDPGR